VLDGGSEFSRAGWVAAPGVIADRAEDLEPVRRVERQPHLPEGKRSLFSRTGQDVVQVAPGDPAR
jgi:hypothetical protein